jgi:hypothetical protein
MTCGAKVQEMLKHWLHGAYTKDLEELGEYETKRLRFFSSI